MGGKKQESTLATASILLVFVIKPLQSIPDVSAAVGEALIRFVLKCNSGSLFNS